ncbi:hypothetical protein ScPMuIL_018307 [Solemya velum]
MLFDEKEGTHFFKKKNHSRAFFSDSPGRPPHAMGLLVPRAKPGEVLQGCGEFTGSLDLSGLDMVTRFSPGFATSALPANLVCNIMVTGTEGLTAFIHDVSIIGTGILIVQYTATKDGNNLPLTQVNLVPLSNAEDSLILADAENMEFQLITGQGNTVQARFAITFMNAAVAPGCPNPGNLEATATAKYISSSGFPNNYPEGQTCTWNVLTSLNNVAFEVEWFDLDNNNLCADRLYMTNFVHGTNTDGDITSLCGKNSFKELVPTVYRSTGTTANVHFVSNADGLTGSGFRIKYWAEAAAPTGNLTEIKICLKFSSRRHTELNRIATIL